MTREFHRHDRAIRESGWDMCHRFATAAHHHEPVCLNSLLFQYEMDLARSCGGWKGKEARAGGPVREGGAGRARTMRARFWDAERGMFFDHDFVTGRRSQYE